MKKLAAVLLALVCLFTARAERGQPEFVEQESESTSAVIRCAGDFVIHDDVYLSAYAEGDGEYDFSSMLMYVETYLQQADYTVTNIDGVLGGEEFVQKHGYSGYPSFSTPSSLLYNLKSCGVDLLTLANNHALDFWYDGLKETVATVEASGIRSIGGYRTQEEKNTPCVVEINGILFGFLNYTDTLNMMDRRSDLDPDALAFGVDFWDRADIEGDISRLRLAGAEVIVCLMHWGTEYREEPSGSQKSEAQALADAGVDVIIGGHPHVVERAEYIDTLDEKGEPKQVLCLYSMGNFLSDQRIEGRECGIIFDFTVTKDEDGIITVSNPVYRTTYCWKYRKDGKTLYRILFSDEGTRPQDMSGSDYARMLQSARDIRNIMEEGCALPAQ